MDGFDVKTKVDFKRKISVLKSLISWTRLRIFKLRSRTIFPVEDGLKDA